MKYSLLMATTLFSLTSFAANATNDSVYTSIAKEDCKPEKTDEEGDSYTGICPGKAGYQVKISGSDARYPLFLRYGGADTPDIVLSDYRSFHSTEASNVEWRGPKISG